MFVVLFLCRLGKLVLAHAYVNSVSEISAGWWDVADGPKEGPESSKSGLRKNKHREQPTHAPPPPQSAPQVFLRAS